MLAEDVPVVQIDVAALAATGYAPENGLIYAAHEDTGTGTEAKGVVLTNGAELLSALTVASGGPRVRARRLQHRRQEGRGGHR